MPSKYALQKRTACGRFFSLLVDKSPGVCSPSALQGELEGAKPASNRIKCRAKPCSARRAWSEATIFLPLRGTKITAFCQAVEKSRRLFRQPDGTVPGGTVLFLSPLRGRREMKRKIPVVQLEHQPLVQYNVLLDTAQGTYTKSQFFPYPTSKIRRDTLY